MIVSLSLGLLAALCWGVHDIFVRYVSQTNGMLASIFTVLTIGSIIMAPVCIYLGNWPDLTTIALQKALVSGTFFGLALIALYQAFAIGPVRLVSPIVGSFPIMSVGLSLWSGQSLELFQILAVLIVVGGITLVAKGENTTTSEKRLVAILWAVSAAFAFFISFAYGQSATADGAELPIIWVSRLAALFIICVIALLFRASLRSKLSQIPLLSMMGLLDGVALAVVLYAGTQAFAAFATVTASIFGLITIILAWAFLGEKMTNLQWLGVGMVFSAIAYLAL